MRKIEVVEYDPAWPELFARERDLLFHTLRDVAVSVHHIGSTSVPGLAAKPIIDILLEVRALAALDAVSGEMEAIGYRSKGELGIPGRRYGKYPHDKARSVMDNNTSREDAKARRGREQARRLKSRGGRALQNYQASRNHS